MTVKWTDVFTEREIEEITKRLQAVAEEEGHYDEEPIVVAIMVSRAEFEQLLTSLMWADRAGQNMEPIGIAFAQEYTEQEVVPRSQPLDVAAAYFWEEYLDKEDDDEDEEDEDEE